MSKIFPKSANALPLQIVIFIFVLGSVAASAVTYYATPKYVRVGYQPVQPVPFDHSLHTAQLGLDCRYCHTSVEKSATS
ncbi:MAG: cytochrome c3 family protein, partial [Candidatus Didemnitutus sp.]|nr:cytochrome c3 family protein [Candidatus Didemnitutus sp.]